MSLGSAVRCAVESDMFNTFLLHLPDRILTRTKGHDIFLPTGSFFRLLQEQILFSGLGCRETRHSQPTCCLCKRTALQQQQLTACKVYKMFRYIQRQNTTLFSCGFVSFGFCSGFILFPEFEVSVRFLVNVSSILPSLVEQSNSSVSAYQRTYTQYNPHCS